MFTPSFSLFFLSITGCFNEEPSFDDLVQKDELFYERASNEIYSGRATSVHSNGQNKWQGTFKDGQIQGTVHQWYEDGQQQSVANYKEGKLHGQQLEWYEDGRQKKESNYKMGVRHGVK